MATPVVTMVLLLRMPSTVQPHFGNNCLEKMKWIQKDLTRKLYLCQFRKSLQFQRFVFLRRGQSSRLEEGNFKQQGSHTLSMTSILESVQGIYYCSECSVRVSQAYNLKVVDEEAKVSDLIC